MVDLVGDDVEVMLLCQGQQLLAAAVGERAAGGVLVGGDGVEKDGAVAGQGLFDGGSTRPCSSVGMGTALSR